jgi:hypothetical protein
LASLTIDRQTGDVVLVVWPIAPNVGHYEVRRISKGGEPRSVVFSMEWNNHVMEDISVVADNGEIWGVSLEYGGPTSVFHYVRGKLQHFPDALQLPAHDEAAGLRRPVLRWFDRDTLLLFYVFYEHKIETCTQMVTVFDILTLSSTKPIVLQTRLHSVPLWTCLAPATSPRGACMMGRSGPDNGLFEISTYE